jgi:cytoskeletal protein RodZ
MILRTLGVLIIGVTVGNAQTHTQSLFSSGSVVTYTPYSSGDVVVVFATSNSSSGSFSISDTASTTWTTLASLTSYASAGKTQSWIGKPSSSNDVITVTDTEVARNTIHVDEFNGLSGSSAGAYESTSGGSSCSTSYVTTSSGSMLWGGMLGIVKYGPEGSWSIGSGTAHDFSMTGFWFVNSSGTQNIDWDVSGPTICSVAEIH